MVSLAALRDSRAGTIATDLVASVSQVELLDRAYTLAAQSFVVLIPLILVIVSSLTGPQSDAVVVEELIDRFGLVGAAAQAVRDLIVIRVEGVYWLGLLVTLYSAFVLGRRVSRTYNRIWGTPLLPASQAWRSVVWIVVQVVLVLALSELRDVARDSGGLATIVLGSLILLLWGVSEYGIQRMFTRGAVARNRLAWAAVLVCVGRIGIVVWSALYLSSSLTRQAESFGPIGVVFALFTLIFAYWLVVLFATQLAALLTDPSPRRPGSRRAEAGERTGAAW